MSGPQSLPIILTANDTSILETTPGTLAWPCHLTSVQEKCYIDVLTGGRFCMMTWHVAHADRGQYKENMLLTFFNILRQWHEDMACCPVN